jgi:hypothetical protein
VLTLLRSCGSDDDIVERLIVKAEVIAHERHSMVLGFKHLLMASGVVVQRAEGVAE